MSCEPLEPFQLVSEFRARRWVAIWQVEAADQDTIHRCLDIAAMAVVRVAGQAAPCLDRIAVAGENGDTVPGFLPVPDGAVANFRIAAIGNFSSGIGPESFVASARVKSSHVAQPASPRAPNPTAGPTRNDRRLRSPARRPSGAI